MRRARIKCPHCEKDIIVRDVTTLGFDFSDIKKDFDVIEKEMKAMGIELREMADGARKRFTKMFGGKTGK